MNHSRLNIFEGTEFFAPQLWKKREGIGMTQYEEKVIDNNKTKEESVLLEKHEDTGKNDKNMQRSVVHHQPSQQLWKFNHFKMVEFSTVESWEIFVNDKITKNKNGAPWEMEIQFGDKKKHVVCHVFAGVQFGDKGM